MYKSERIADGEVQSDAVFEARDVVEARLLGLIGHVESDADVKAEYDEVEVIAYAGAGAEGDVSEGGSGQLCAGAVCIGTEQPDVSGVQEDCSAEVANQTCAQFNVRLQSDVARLVHIGVTT